MKNSNSPGKVGPHSKARPGHHKHLKLFQPMLRNTDHALEIQPIRRRTFNLRLVWGHGGYDIQSAKFEQNSLKVSGQKRCLSAQPCLSTMIKHYELYIIVTSKHAHIYFKSAEVGSAWLENLIIFQGFTAAVDGQIIVIQAF